MKDIVFVNGKYCKSENAVISVFDRGFLYGDGAFETMRAYSGKIFKLNVHLKRLQYSLKYLKIRISNNKIKNAVISTLEKSKIKNAYIRVSVTRGQGLGLISKNNPTLVVIVKKLYEYDKKYYQKGVKVITSSYTRFLPNMISTQIKSLNYLWGILGRIDTQKKNIFEVIFLNNNGYITEGSMSNIFIVKDSKILTPPVYCGILSGITRSVIFEIAEEEKLNIEERLLTSYDIYNADECFLTNSIIEIMPVSFVNGIKIGNKEKNVVKFLREKYKEKIYRELKISKILNGG